MRNLDAAGARAGPWGAVAGGIGLCLWGGAPLGLGSRQLVQERGATVQGRVGAGCFGEGQPLSPGAECLFEQAAVVVKSWQGVQAV